MAPDFDRRNYEFKKLNDLVRNIESLELSESASGHLRVRPKPTADWRSARPPR
ncbi:MAG: hypothetical protein ACYCZU_05055 [Devosia sp.]